MDTFMSEKDKQEKKSLVLEPRSDERLHNERNQQTECLIQKCAAQGNHSRPLPALGEVSGSVSAAK